MDFNNKCCDIAGGLVEFSIDGVKFTTTGDITINPSRFVSDVLANNDGKGTKTLEPKVPMAEITLRSHCGLNIADITDGCAVDCVIREETTGRRHMFPKAFVYGDPSYNQKTGEISGISVASSGYKVREI